MKPDLYLRNGAVVAETGVFHGGVTVANGVITQIVADTPTIDAAETIDLQGKWLLPGLVTDTCISMSPASKNRSGIAPGPARPRRAA